jgi:hypothetical protein
MSLDLIYNDEQMKRVESAEHTNEDRGPSHRAQGDLRSSIIDLLLRAAAFSYYSKRTG